MALNEDVKKKLIEMVEGQYTQQLAAMGPMLKKRDREAMIDGFKSGLRAGVAHTERIIDVGEGKGSAEQPVSERINLFIDTLYAETGIGNKVPKEEFFKQLMSVTEHIEKLKEDA